MWLLSGLGALMLPCMVLAVIYDVLLRDLGLPTPSWPDQMVEYGILYLTVLAAPLLTRQRGHVFIGSLRGAVPYFLRRLMDRIAAATCAAICALMSLYLVLYTVRLASAGTLDAKGFDMPRWLITAPVALSFALMTIEFLRFTIGAQRLHRDDDLPGAVP